MAIEIKRTPVLKDHAAATFMAKVRKRKSRATSKDIKKSLSSAQKILLAFKKSA